MRIFYSASTGGFYVQGVHRQAPDDAVEIKEKQYRHLLAQQSQGLEIRPDGNGRPVAVPPPAPNADEAALLVRRKRERLLRESDCWVLPDYPIPAELRHAVFRYRDELRRITEQKGFPFEVTWPTPPRRPRHRTA